MRAAVLQRLSLILEWYRGMIAEETGRIACTYDPVDDVVVFDESAIRDIGSIWDVEVLSRFLGRADMIRIVEVPLRRKDLIARDGTLLLESRFVVRR